MKKVNTMELKKQLELVDVAYENDNKKAVMTFLDAENKEIRVVNFNKQSFDSVKKKFVDDSEKAAKVDEWCQTYFKLTFDKLEKAVGTKHDIYCYADFNSLWECDIVNKFDDDQVGEIIEGVVKEVIVDNVAIKIRFEYDGDTYESKMTYAKYFADTKVFYKDPQKEAKQYEKFEEKFGISVENKDEMVGKKIMVEVKKAFGNAIYCEVKPFSKKKK